MLWLLVALAVEVQAEAPIVVVRCDVIGDARARVYELRRAGEGDAARWHVAMRDREIVASPVVLPLPGAAPVVTHDTATLEYRTQNGGRDLRWRVTPAGATLDLHANFELEVNIEPDLDPRVELMNTEGSLANLACEIAPPR